jgi:hypothetical protein
MLYPQFKGRVIESIDLHRDRHLTAFHPQRPTPANHRQGAEENQEQGNCNRNPDQLIANHSFVFYVPFHFRLQIRAIKKLGFQN